MRERAKVIAYGIAIAAALVAVVAFVQLPGTQRDARVAEMTASFRGVEYDDPGRPVQQVVAWVAAGVAVAGGLGGWIASGDD